jgi:hypothetical protein
MASSAGLDPIADGLCKYFDSGPGGMTALFARKEAFAAASGQALDLAKLSP